MTEILVPDILAVEIDHHMRTHRYDGFIGIDPGKSGSMSLVWWDGRPAASYARGDWTEADQADWMRQFNGGSFVAIVERVHSSPQMGVKSSFTFGQSYGFLRGLLVANQIPFREVAPAVWQRSMGCLSSGDKNKTKQAAQQRWPQMKITHRNADSLLIAEYARGVRW
jgi:crossover junction endodeoxyribonuclease RuvC